MADKNEDEEQKQAGNSESLFSYLNDKAEEKRKDRVEKKKDDNQSSPLF